ncbi:napsin-A isoform X2 [Alligator sinensis]|uniref:Napsin-A isoform X2 n=2 Tax=Alligator sinensis TaxID=38654 RepID=A0A3Q0G129_ALLSI|nr:napsin-A isoform X2 [Alligator sinensis]
MPGQYLGQESCPGPQDSAMSAIYSEVAGDEPPGDSFWMPKQYQSTVRRLDNGYQVCDQLVSCFQERARVERTYGQHLARWVQKWRPLVDASPTYGTARRAWQAFLDATERLSQLHGEMQQALVAEEVARMRAWQRDHYHRKVLGGFREACDLENGFRRAQRGWTRKLHKEPLTTLPPQVEKAKAAYHLACRKEHQVAGREAGPPGGPPLAPDRQRALREEHQRRTQETHKERQRYEHILAELTRASPRYMEEMEMVFEQGQAQEQRRIAFLKDTLLALQRRLDPTTHPGVQATQSQLRQAIADISAHDDLAWWRREHGPGMPTTWPQFEAWSPEPGRQSNGMKLGQEEKVPLQSNSPVLGSVAEPVPTPPAPPLPAPVPPPMPAPGPGRGQRVRAVYDYTGQEPDELSFSAGEELTKLEDEDEQGWCRGVTDGGRIGLYPANYVQPVQ